MPFTLTTDKTPKGGQPEAIKQLIDGFKNGNKKETLLGITGSGKSLDYEETILIQTASGMLRNVQIGKYVQENFSNPHALRNTKYQSVAGDKIVSFSPDTYQLELKPIHQVSQHISKYVYRVRLDDGTKVRISADHNCYTFSDGEFHLTKTSDLSIGDWLPLSRVTLQPEKCITKLSLIPYAAGRRIDIRELIDRYDSEKELLSRVLQEKNGYGQKRAKNRAQYVYDKGIKSEDFERYTSLLHVSEESERDICTFHSQVNQKLPVSIPVNKSLARFFGLYVAEGHARNHVFMISNGQQHLRKLCSDFCDQYNITNRQTNENDVWCYSKIIASLLHEFGTRAHNKRVPDIIYNLDSEKLGLFLQALYDGDGWVEKNSIEYCSKSSDLIDDIRRLLLRFNITSRTRRKIVNGSESTVLSISGQNNMRNYIRNIGFSINYKHERSLLCLRAEANTNVDVIPRSGSVFKKIRLDQNVHQWQLGGTIACTQSHISQIESGKRNPSQQIFSQLSKLRALLTHEKKYLNLPHYNFRKIVEIEIIPSTDGYVYDIAVEGNETFAVGGGNLLVHNTFVVSQIIQSLQKKTLVIAHNKTLALQLYHEFKELFPDNRVEYFVSYYDYYQPESYMPTTDTYIEKDFSKNDVLEALRLRATASLLTNNDTIVVASVSCIYGLGDPEDWKTLSLHLQLGEEIDRQVLLQKLVAMQYERNDTAPVSGQFRVKGETIDIIPGYDRNILRVELFGDEVERLTILHPLTLEKKGSLDSIALFPAKHYVSPEEKQVKAIDSIKEELDQWLPTLDTLPRERLKQRTNFDLEMIKEIGHCSGIENYSRHFDGRKAGTPPFTLIDFFGDDWLLVIDESHQTIPQIHAMHRGDRSRKQSLVEFGFRLPSAYDNRPLTFEEFEKKMPQTLFVSATPGDYELKQSQVTTNLIIRPTGLLDPIITVKETEGQIDDLITEIESTVQRGNRAFVTTLTKKMAEDLTNYLSQHGVKVRYMHSDIDTMERTEIIRQLRLGDFDVLVGINLLREGLDVPEVELVAILDADKEGFLRNERSFLQTIGRAARNKEGRVVMYGDKMTKSMQRAITVTHARREQQIKYNEEHGITPQTIIKDIPEQTAQIKDIKHLPKPELRNRIDDLQKEMQQAASDLDFERAIEIRDQIALIQKELEN